MTVWREGMSMWDKQEIIQGSLVQHGKSNDRIYLMHLNPDRKEELVQDLMDLASTEGYGKIFIKIPAGEEAFFLSQGFRRESIIPNYFSEDAAVFMGYYLTESRKKVSEEDEHLIHNVLECSFSSVQGEKPLPSGCFIQPLSTEHSESIAALYTQVFSSYPFPIHEASYIRETMDSHISYFGCFLENQLIGLSSAEADHGTGAVEMTDFAVLPAYRGKGLARALLSRMEKEERDKGRHTAYTIARAVSYGMNKTFAQAGYSFAGTLTNNTQISGSIESMNVWYISLQEGAEGALK